MPIYEFHCEKCERDSEILVRSSDWKGTACPHCGSKKLSKKFSVFASAGSGGNDPAAIVGESRINSRQPRATRGCARVHCSRRSQIN